MLLQNQTVDHGYVSYACLSDLLVIGAPFDVKMSVYDLPFFLSEAPCQHLQLKSPKVLHNLQRQWAPEQQRAVTTDAFSILDRI